MILARAGNEWTLLRLPSKLHVVHQYARGRRLALVHQSPQDTDVLKIFEWDLSSRRRSLEATITPTPWNHAEQDPEHFRPSARSADGRIAASIAKPLGSRVLLHAPEALPVETNALFFGLSKEDRAPAPVIDMDLAPLTALNLSFSPDGSQLLGWNPLGWEVHGLEARERTRSQYADAEQPTHFAGWLDDETIVEVSQHGHVWTFGANGVRERRGTLPLASEAELLDAGLVDLPNGRHLLAHSSFRPLLFEVRDPQTLALEHQLSVTHLPSDFELDWIALLPGGVAVFRLSVGRSARIGAVNVGAAVRAGVPTVPWREISAP